MKKITLLSILITAFVFANAQLVNLNPNPNGEQWLAGGWKTPNSSELEKIRQIPELKISDLHKTKDLPAQLDNSENMYFRPIFNQTHGCCAQASGIAYNFTYEMNRMRGTSASLEANQYPTHYTYNFLNGGDGNNGSWFWDGWDIIEANGCPTVAEYGSLAQEANYWMSGYDAYQNGMDNRSIEQFSINVSTPEGLETLKYWFYNHGEDAETGGIVNFGAGVSDVFSMSWDDNIIYHWGESVNHAMTFVGWDDNIEYDYNNDGQITNDQDINGDQIVDMRDWERGALIMVNSWGEFWGNGGKAYVMYKTLAEPTNNGGIFENKVYSIKVRDTYQPSALAKVKLSHSIRNKVEIRAGISTGLSAEVPDYEMVFPIFNNQGGQFPMQGNNSNPIEITLDITPILSQCNSMEEARFFIVIDETDQYEEASGTILEFSVIDVLNGTEFTSSQTNVNIENNTQTYIWTDASIEFSAPEIETANLPDGEKDMPYSTQLDATGGTEPYFWKILYDYQEDALSNSYPNISGNQLTPTNDDDGYVLINLPFDFPFFGENYSQFYMTTDGSLLFDDAFTYVRNEEAIRSNKAISVFASDLMIFPEDGDGIWYEANTNSATFRWKTSLYSYQEANVEATLKIYKTGEIEFYYGTGIMEGMDWAAGISNGDGDNFLITDNSGINNPSNTQTSIYSEGFPLGLDLSWDGTYSGTPILAGSWDLKFKVTDFDNISKIKTLSLTIDGINQVQTKENSFELSCYPNPFSQNSTLEFYLPESQNVVIEIYNITGEKIAEIVNQTFKSGKNSIGLNSANLNMQEGVYFLKFQSEKFNQTQKIVLKK